MNREERIERLMGRALTNTLLRQEVPMGPVSHAYLEWTYAWAESIVDYVDTRAALPEGEVSDG